MLEHDVSSGYAAQLGQSFNLPLQLSCKHSSGRLCQASTHTRPARMDLKPTQGTHCKAGEVATLVLDAASIAGSLEAIGSIPPLGRLCRPCRGVLAAELQGGVGCGGR